MEPGDIDVGNSEYGGQETMVILDRVFIPNEMIFMNGEHEFASMLIERFTCYHRRSYVCKTGLGDVLIGAAAAIADYNDVKHKVVFDWGKRKDRIKQYLTEQNPDMLSIVEYDRHDLEFQGYDRILPTNEKFTFFWKANIGWKCTFLDSATKDFKDAHSQKSYMIVKCEKDDQTMLLAITHMVSETQDNKEGDKRLSMMRQISSKMNDFVAKAILTFPFSLATKSFIFELICRIILNLLSPSLLSCVSETIWVIASNMV
jgi:hypothetical protein